MNVLFDTNILIDFLRRVAAAKEELDRYRSEEKSISLITWIEVMAGAKVKKQTGTRELLDEFLVFSISENVAERSAVIRRERRLKLPDAVIWATAEEHGECWLLEIRETIRRTIPAFAFHIKFKIEVERVDESFVEAGA